MSSDPEETICGSIIERLKIFGASGYYARVTSFRIWFAIIIAYRLFTSRTKKASVIDSWSITIWTNNPYGSGQDGTTATPSLVRLGAEILYRSPNTVDGPPIIVSRPNAFKPRIAEAAHVMFPLSLAGCMGAREHPVGLGSRLPSRKHRVLLRLSSGLNRQHKQEQAAQNAKGSENSTQRYQKKMHWPDIPDDSFGHMHDGRNSVLRVTRSSVSSQKPTPPTSPAPLRSPTRTGSTDCRSCHMLCRDIDCLRAARPQSTQAQKARQCR